MKHEAGDVAVVVDVAARRSWPFSPSAPVSVKREAFDSSALFGKIGYKFWVLATILLLAFWSMFTGSVTLTWSSISHLSRFSDNPKFAVPVDILEVEEREKLVRNMWDVYSHSATARLPRFWLEVFQAAYEHLVSEWCRD